MIDNSTVIDFHGHVGSWNYLGMIEDQPKMLRAMDTVGIDRSCVFNIFHPDGTRGNDMTAEFVSKSPERFIGFAYVSPTMPYRMLPELERAIDCLGLRAIKLYPQYTPYPLNHSAWDPVYTFANDRELVVLSHTGVEADPKYLGEAASRFPKAMFVAGHSGNVEPYRGQAIEAAQKYQNFYLETCSTYRTPGVIEELVAKAGAERILFGSDVPLMDPRSQIGKIITADISDDAKRLVLGENAKRLLKL